MLINCDDTKVESHVRFVSYTGIPDAWPNTCHGILTLNIDGNEVKFGNFMEADYPNFWYSGDRCTANGVEKDEWQINVRELPEEFRKYATEIDYVFNKNVEWGCCGGCR